VAEGHLNELWLGPRCFLVKAVALPARTNQRPGVTLLAARGSCLRLLVDGLGEVAGHAFLFAPEVERRFLAPQPHFSLTLEPGHPYYLRCLTWARRGPSARALRAVGRLAAALESVERVQQLDDWLHTVVTLGRVPAPPTDTRLEFLLRLVDEGDAETPLRAEHLWRRFRSRYPGTQSQWSRWLQQTIGLSLRKVVLGRKLRQAMNRLGTGHDATTIAHHAGFADSAHLSRLTVRTFGVVPREAKNRSVLHVRSLGGDAG
jgi:Helix-turn-helix domain